MKECRFIFKNQLVSDSFYSDPTISKCPTDQNPVVITLKTNIRPVYQSFGSPEIQTISCGVRLIENSGKYEFYIFTPDYANASMVERKLAT